MYISGVGGQGIIKISIILGEAAMKMGKPVVMSEVHGMAQRGGVVSTELKIGPSQSPIIKDGCADLLLAFEPIEALRAINKISKDSYIILDKNPIIPFNMKENVCDYPDISVILEELKSKSKKLHVLDAFKISKKSRHIQTANMVILGGAAAIPGFPLDKEALIDSMIDNLPEKSLNINLKAFKRGFTSISNNI